MMNKMVDGVVVTMTTEDMAQYHADQLDQPSAEDLLAQKRAAAIDEMVAHAERKRLEVLRAAVEVEFTSAKSEQDVAEKLAQLKGATEGNIMGGQKDA